MSKLPGELPKLVEVSIKGIQEVKGKDIVYLDLREIHTRVCDFFIICHGDSSTQVNAIAESVEKETWQSLKENAWHKEGMQNAEWVLMDYGDVVIHIFHKSKREYYNIENLWADAHVHEIEEKEVI